jgi:hypothetical protein
VNKAVASKLQKRKYQQNLLFKNQNLRLKNQLPQKKKSSKVNKNNKRRLQLEKFQKIQLKLLKKYRHQSPNKNAKYVCKDYHLTLLILTSEPYLILVEKSSTSIY